MCTVIFVVWLFQNMTHYSTENTQTLCNSHLLWLLTDGVWVCVFERARTGTEGVWRPSRSDIISGCWATQTQTHAHTPTHTWAAGLEWLCSKRCRLWLTPWTWHPHCPGHRMSPRHTLLAHKKTQLLTQTRQMKMNENESCLSAPRGTERPCRPTSFVLFF